MLKQGWVGFALVWMMTSLSVPALASEFDDKDKDHGERWECFNLYCEYQREEKDGSGYEKCQAAATFQKKVTWRGHEIEDDSKFPFNPAFEVTCDGERLFTNSAYRFTDSQGTRIQAEAGPYPAILLPKGSLRDGHHYSVSALELGQRQTLKGYCYVYVGPR